MKDTILWLFLLFLLPACSMYNERNELEIIPVEASLHQIETKPIDDFAKSVKYVQLETRDDILIGRIHKIIMTDDKFIVVYDRRCSVFDEKGDFLSDIGKYGEGPEEYLYITDIFAKDGLIYIYDTGKKKILCYNFSGDFVDEIIPPMEYSNLLTLADGNMLGFIGQVMGDEVTMGYIWDGTSVLDSIPNSQIFLPGTIKVTLYNESVVYNHNKQNYYKHLLNDTIYKISDNRLQPRYVLDQGKYRTIPEKRYQLTHPAQTPFKGVGVVKVLGESANYLIFNGVIDKIRYDFFWNKKDKTLHNLQLTYPSDLSEDKYFTPDFISGDKKYLISPFIKEDSDDNPLLVIAEL